LAKAAHQLNEYIFLGEQASDQIQLYAGSVGYQNIKKHINSTYLQEYISAENTKDTPRIAKGVYKPSTLVFNNKLLSP